MRPSKLTPEQEGEVYRRAKAGESYASIQTWLAGQGVTLAKSSISEVIPRVERRALATKPAPLPDDYIDPQTGAWVEVSEETELRHIRHLLMAMLYDPKANPFARISAGRMILQTEDRLRALGGFEPLPQRRRARRG